MKSDKWGYRTGKSNLINLDNNDPSLYKRVLKKVPGLKSCLFCGSCSATCTASNDGMNFRKVHQPAAMWRTFTIERIDPAVYAVWKMQSGMSQKH